MPQAALIRSRSAGLCRIGTSPPPIGEKFMRTASGQAKAPNPGLRISATRSSRRISGTRAANSSASATRCGTRPL